MVGSSCLLCSGLADYGAMLCFTLPCMLAHGYQRAPHNEFMEKTHSKADGIGTGFPGACFFITYTTQVTEGSRIRVLNTENAKVFLDHAYMSFKDISAIEKTIKTTLFPHISPLGPNHDVRITNYARMESEDKVQDMPCTQPLVELR